MGVIGTRYGFCVNSHFGGIRSITDKYRVALCAAGQDLRESPTLGHSHIPVKHLLKQVEMYHSKRQRGVRPAWLTEFVNDAADLFDPLSDVARVGYDAMLADDRWVVGLFLGRIEIVGGRDDGSTEPPGFEFDVLGLIARFTEVERVRWNAVPAETEEAESFAATSFLSIDGRISENPLRVQVYSVPPSEMGPGLRKYPDGRCDPV